MVKTQKRPLHYHVYNGTKEQLQEDQIAEQLTLKEFEDPFTGEPYKK